MHTRGRLLNARIYRYVIGTTHAHAGQTACASCGYISIWNHPCTRGADGYAPAYLHGAEEPPMHTRGRQVLWSSDYQIFGTTHAHAGQT